jgi:ORF6N domain
MADWTAPVYVMILAFALSLHLQMVTPMQPAPPQISIQSRIALVRDQRVMLDADLAELYGVETKVLVQAVKRNLARFPADFMIQLSAEEWQSLRSQTVTSNAGRGGRRYAPYAFTKQGLAGPLSPYFFP